MISTSPDYDAQAAPSERAEAEVDPTKLPWHVSLSATWGIFCGFLASGPLRWGKLISLQLLAAWLLAGPLLDYLFETWLGIARYRLPAMDRSKEAATTPIVLPYAEPGTPGWRLVRRLNHWLRHWQRAFWPKVLRPLLLALILATGGLMIALQLGRRPLQTFGAALFIGLLTAVATRPGDVWPDSVALALQALAGWSMVIGLMGAWQPASLGAGVLSALALIGHQQLARRPGSTWAEWLARAAWWGLAIMLLLAKQPLLGAGVAVGAIWQELRQGQARGGISLAAWMVASALVALASRYWS